MIADNLLDIQGMGMFSLESVLVIAIGFLALLLIIPAISAPIDEGYLWVNHEYFSYPISALVFEESADLLGLPDAFA